MSSDSQHLARSEPSPIPAHERVFNNDLLMNDDSVRKKTDLQKAKEQFPEIIHVLDCPALREKFAAYEKEANKARERVRALGFAAVLSVTAALIAVATKPIWPHTSWTRWFALLVEVGGLVATIVAVSGLWIGDWKRRWLESRLMTERLRQWHFQILLRRGHEVESSCKNPGAAAEFEKARAQWLNDFLNAYEGKLDSKLELLANEPTHVETWLHNPATHYSGNSQVLRHVFVAYERLRFDHQRDYAIYKLKKSTDKPFWEFLKWPATLQLAALSGVSSFCFICALVCSAILVYDHAFGIPENVETYVITGAIVIALIGAALRAIQEGLALDKDIERYNDYRGRTSQLCDRFEHTTESKERLHLMEELELASVDEMKGFLRTHHNARFVL
jgi:hypothetical protein